MLCTAYRLRFKNPSMTLYTPTPTIHFSPLSSLVRFSIIPPTSYALAKSTLLYSKHTTYFQCPASACMPTFDQNTTHPPFSSFGELLLIFQDPAESHLHPSLCPLQNLLNTLHFKEFLTFYSQTKLFEDQAYFILILL